MFTLQPGFGTCLASASREKASRSEAQPSGALPSLARVHHVNLPRPSRGGYVAIIAQSDLARAAPRVYVHVHFLLEADKLP